MVGMDLPCENCAQPLHCTGRWPDDDKHKPGQVRGCFGSAARSVVVRSDHTANVIKKDTQLGKDLDAYKRLRAAGTQPPMIDGSAQRELLSKQHEVERRPDPKLVERVVNESGDTKMAAGTQLEGKL